MTKINLKQQLEAFDQGIILDSEGNENDCYNFYDWFCKDEALKGRATKLFKQVKRWAKFRNTDTEKVYVFFKNNCPVFGSLYDDFRICDLESGDVIWTVTAKSGHTGQAEVWGRLNNFQEAIAVGKNLNEIYKQSF
ncbi:MAG: hypothetical protein EBS34_12990 [Flavobacteriales bacterium]|nr:hypothetical protein [Flavobacteriales bacterium]